MKSILSMCALSAALAIQVAFGAEPVSYQATSFGGLKEYGQAREVKPLDAPENPFRDQYTVLDHWVYQNAHTLEEVKQRKPSNDRSVVGFVDQNGFLIPLEYSAEQIMFVRFNKALIGEHMPFSSSYFQIVAYGEMDDATKAVREGMNLRLRSQYLPQFPDWLLALTNNSFLMKLDENKPFPGSPTDWNWWMDYRGAEKQPDGQWKVWTLDSAVPLSDGSWVVTTIDKCKLVGGEPFSMGTLPRNTEQRADLGTVRPVTSPFPKQVFGSGADEYGYCFVDTWRSASGVALQPQRPNQWSTWQGMFDAYVAAFDEAVRDQSVSKGSMISGEYMLKTGPDGLPRVIYHLLQGKVFDSTDPVLRRQVTLPGLSYGQEITRQDLLKLQAYRDANAAPVRTGIPVGQLP